MSYGTAFGPDQFAIPLADNVVVPFYAVARNVPFNVAGNTVTVATIPLPSGMQRFWMPSPSFGGGSTFVYTEDGTGVFTQTMNMLAGDLSMVSNVTVPISGGIALFSAQNTSNTFWNPVSGCIAVRVGAGGGGPPSGHISVFIPVLSIASSLTGGAFQ